MLEPTKEKVLQLNAKLTGKLENRDPQLRKASGYAFYNTSRYDFQRLLADAPGLAVNLGAYIRGFSPNMREVLEKFNFDDEFVSTASRPPRFHSSRATRTRSPTVLPARGFR